RDPPCLNERQITKTLAGLNILLGLCQTRFISSAKMDHLSALALLFQHPLLIPDALFVTSRGAFTGL
ncbi:MAG: hypothetical protein AAF293_12910, partial [Pseudomonadota bacterium]